MKVGVLGASGYVGGELLRIMVGHSGVELAAATSRQYKGEYVYRVHPHLRGLLNLRFSDQNIDQMASQCDLVFSSVPLETALNAVPKLREVGVRVVDLSPAFRLRKPGEYQTWYRIQHPHPEMLEHAVYGLPEIHRDKIGGAGLVTAPGCMASAAILALAPLAKADAIEENRIVVDAKMGSSGSGVKPTVASHHAHRYGVVRPYKPVAHRHTGEIEQELRGLAGKDYVVAMSAHAVNIVRGILCTIHSFTKHSYTVPELWRLYRSLYEKEPFIRLVRDSAGLQKYPDPKAVVGSNFCDIGFEVDTHVNRVVALAATDNLLKGAAGTAVQCMNLMLGFDETTSLKLPPLYPM